MVSDKVVIKNPTGLHLRPAGLFCKTAMQYKSKITVYKKMKNEEVNANAKSVLSVLGACIKMCIRDRDQKEETAEELLWQVVLRKRSQRIQILIQGNILRLYWRNKDEKKSKKVVKYMQKMPFYFKRSLLY